jgi:hypothetical protein
MHVAQPVERGWARYRGRFDHIRIPDAIHRLRRVWEYRAGALLARREIGLWSESWIGREELLKDLVDLARRHHWFPRIDSGWMPHDVRFYGDRWCKADLVTVTENHGGPKRLTRLRLVERATFFQKALLVGLGYLMALAFAAAPHAILYVVPFILATLWQVRWSARQLHTAVLAAALTTARQLGMTVVDAPGLLTRKPAGEGEEAGAEVLTAARTASPFFWRRLWAAARRMSLTLF